MTLAYARNSHALLALTLAGLALAVGCANPVHRGFEAFQTGDCKTAYANWMRAAKEGDATAQYDLGILYERGCPAIGLKPAPKTAVTWFSASAKSGFVHAYAKLGDYYRSGTVLPRDDNKAIAHYHYAARWGVESAAAALRSMNVPVPPADLLEARRRQQRAQEQADNDAAAILIGSILTGAAQGYADGSAAYGGTRGYQPSTPATAGSTYQPTQIYRPTPECNSDFACGTGQVCVKPQFQSVGICLGAVNAFGLPTPRTPAPSSVMPNSGLAKPACRAPNVGCPVGFTCDERLNACVK